MKRTTLSLSLITALILSVSATCSAANRHHNASNKGHQHRNTQYAALNAYQQTSGQKVALPGLAKPKKVHTDSVGLGHMSSSSQSIQSSSRASSSAALDQKTANANNKAANQMQPAPARTWGAWAKNMVGSGTTLAWNGTKWALSLPAYVLSPLSIATSWTTSKMLTQLFKLPGIRNYLGEKTAAFVGSIVGLATIYAFNPFGLSAQMLTTLHLLLTASFGMEMFEHLCSIVTAMLNSQWKIAGMELAASVIVGLLIFDAFGVRTAMSNGIAKGANAIDAANGNVISKGANTAVNWAKQNLLNQLLDKFPAIRINAEALATKLEQAKMYLWPQATPTPKAVVSSEDITGCMRNTGLDYEWCLEQAAPVTSPSKAMTVYKATANNTSMTLTPKLKAAGVLPYCMDPKTGRIRLLLGNGPTNHDCVMGNVKCAQDRWSDFGGGMEKKDCAQQCTMDERARATAAREAHEETMGFFSGTSENPKALASIQKGTSFWKNKLTANNCITTSSGYKYWLVNVPCQPEQTSQLRALYNRVAGWFSRIAMPWKHEDAQFIVYIDPYSEKHDFRWIPAKELLKIIDATPANQEVAIPDPENPSRMLVLYHKLVDSLREGHAAIDHVVQAS